MAEDWRLGLARNLVERCQSAGIRKDKDQITRAVYRLADQEEELLRTRPDLEEGLPGYRRAVREYGKNGMSMLVNFVLKLWDGEPPSVSTDLPPVIPRPAVEAVLLPEPISVVFCVRLDKEYDQTTVLEYLTSYLSEKFSDKFLITRSFWKSGTVLDIGMDVGTFLADIYDNLLKVSWVVDVVTVGGEV
jgi:hypothetical protein